MMDSREDLKGQLEKRRWVTQELRNKARLRKLTGKKEMHIETHNKERGGSATQGQTGEQKREECLILFLVQSLQNHGTWTSVLFSVTQPEEGHDIQPLCWFLPRVFLLWLAGFSSESPFLPYLKELLPTLSTRL
jgi:hypothetical protein